MCDRHNDNKFYFSLIAVGYGDIYPITHLGRLMTIVACLIGIFILSLFVVALNNTISLTKNEDQAFKEITKVLKIEKNLKGFAIRIIQTWMRIINSKNKGKDRFNRFILRMDLIDLIERFKIKRK